MKLQILTTLFLLSALSLSAQDKAMNKISNLYQNQDFDNCILAAEKYNKSHTNNPKGYYYLGFSYFGQYLKSNKETQLNSARRTIYTAIVKDREKQFVEDFAPQMKQLKDSLNSYQSRYYTNGDVNKAKEYGEMIAKIYGDTTDIFMHIIHPEYFEAPKVVGKSLAFYNGPTNQTDIAGKKQGVWVEKYSNGNRKTQINFVDDKPLGEFYRFYERTGGVSAQLYYSDYDDASAILYAENGDKLAMGYYHNQKKDSLWQYLVMDSIVVAQEFYKNGVKDGKQSTYYITGFPLEEIEYKNGVKHGTWKRYYETFQLQFETTYQNNMLEGQYTKYDINGNVIISGIYKAGLPVGDWKYYDFETKKFKIFKYIDGKPENADEIAAQEAKQMKEMIELNKNLPDPQDYMSNPEDYPINNH